MIELTLALAPVLIIAFYIYIRDKYEKEPIGILLKTFLLGAVITVPIIFVEQFLDSYWENTFGSEQSICKATYTAFVVASFTEEAFKFLAFYILIWQNRNFNEKFDGIVYAVYVSLGFATVENFLYVFEGGIQVALLRALTAVPAHALFGVTMGYYFGLAKFRTALQSKYLILSLLVPILLHGIYDFILMANNAFLLLVFLPFIIYLWYVNFKRMRHHSEKSIFRPEKNN